MRESLADRNADQQCCIRKAKGEEILRKIQKSREAQEKTEYAHATFGQRSQARSSFSHGAGREASNKQTAYEGKKNDRRKDRKHRCRGDLAPLDRIARRPAGNPHREGF